MNHTGSKSTSARGPVNQYRSPPDKPDRNLMPMQREQARLSAQTLTLDLCTLCAISPAAKYSLILEASLKFTAARMQDRFGIAIADIAAFKHQFQGGLKGDIAIEIRHHVAIQRIV